MILFEQFLKWEQTTQDTIDFKRIYADIAGGDGIAGLVLSEIVYWHLPSKKNGAPNKMKVSKDGKEWIASTRYDWWDRVRLSPRQVDRLLNQLVKLNIVEKAVYRFAGSPTTHVRLNYEIFMQLWQERIDAPLVNPFLPVGENEITDTSNANKQSREKEIDKSVKTLTESTSENTTEIKEKESSSSDESILSIPVVMAESIETQSLDISIVQEKGVTESPEVEELSDIPKPDIADIAQAHIEQTVAAKPKVKSKSKPETPSLRPDEVYKYADWQLVLSKAMKFSLTDKGCQRIAYYIRFFNGTCDFKTKKGESEFNLYQCNGDIGGDGLENVMPLSLIQVVALTLYYRVWKEPYDKTKQATTYLPPGTGTLQEKCRNFLADADYEKWIAMAKPKLDALLNNDGKALDTTLAVRPSHKVVTAKNEVELSPEDQAAALKIISDFNFKAAGKPPVAEKAIP